jgi:pimeloyl-ACP methyl ester carboxylesterase
VAGVMLVSSPAGLVDQLHPDTPGYPAAAAQQMAGDQADNITGERFFVRLMTAKPLPPDVEEAWVVQTLRMPVYARLAMRGRPLNNRDLLPTLTLPMAIVVGALDKSMPVDTLQALSAAHPNMVYRSVPDAGHALAWENPAVFNPLLLDFLARATATAPAR